MGPVERLTTLLEGVVARTGPFAPAVLFGATFVEYVFPPFPGDTIVLLGAWYVVQGELSWPAAFTAVTAGAVAGAWVDWRVGSALALAVEGRGALRGPLDSARLARFEAAYRRWGGLLLVANRFLPGIRAFLFVAAGATRIPLRKVLLLGGISAAAWNAVLLGTGALVARNATELAELLARYTHVVWMAMGLAAAVLAARALARRRRPR
ncbi:MAG TPA: VTT domain-containing protein [Anaeromyxobacteraceae bacterium]